MIFIIFVWGLTMSFGTVAQVGLFSMLWVVYECIMSIGGLMSGLKTQLRGGGITCFIATVSTLNSLCTLSVCVCYTRNEIKEDIVDNGNVLHEIKRRKTSLIGHNLRRNCLIKHVI